MNNQANNGANTLLDAEAFEAAYRLLPQAVVRELVEALGSNVVASIGGVRNNRSVYQWMSGEREPERLPLLRFALQLVFLMRHAGEADKTIGAWFVGVNPRLADDTPASLLATADLGQVAGPITNAARAFAGHVNSQRSNA
jgi:hypothetical protein